MMPTKYGIVFGTKVREDYSPTPVAKERILAAIQLYHAKKIEKIFISGDNRSHKEAESIAAVAEKNGVPFHDIIIDILGIDTQDTCRHFKHFLSLEKSLENSKAIVLTQNFHMARTLAMCKKAGVDATGLAVNALNLLPSRGNSWWEIYTTRLGRFMRESALSWLFIVGLYDDFSQEAEVIEPKKTLFAHQTMSKLRYQF